MLAKELNSWDWDQVNWRLKWRFPAGPSICSFSPLLQTSGETWPKTFSGKPNTQDVSSTTILTWQRARSSSSAWKEPPPTSATTCWTTTCSTGSWATKWPFIGQCMSARMHTRMHRSGTQRIKAASVHFHRQKLINVVSAPHPVAVWPLTWVTLTTKQKHLWDLTGPLRARTHNTLRLVLSLCWNPFESLWVPLC